MNSFFDIIQELNKVRISREEYYNLCDLYYRLHNIDVIEIVDDEYRLVPSYIFKGKRMELYEYELLISSNSEGSLPQGAAIIPSTFLEINVDKHARWIASFSMLSTTMVV